MRSTPPVLGLFRTTEVSLTFFKLPSLNEFGTDSVLDLSLSLILKKCTDNFIDQLKIKESPIFAEF